MPNKSPRDETELSEQWPAREAIRRSSILPGWIKGRSHDSSLLKMIQYRMLSVIYCVNTPVIKPMLMLIRSLRTLFPTVSVVLPCLPIILVSLVSE